MKDPQILEEEIEILKRDNAQIRERLSVVENQVQVLSALPKKVETVETLPNKIEEGVYIRQPDLTSSAIVENQRDDSSKEKPKSSSNTGIILIVLGVLLSLTGVGMLIGLPLLIVGIYDYYKNSKNKVGEKVKEKDYLENLNINIPEPVPAPQKIDEDGSIRNINNYSISTETKVKTASFEEEIGIKWFARIGILALVVGVGFFIKYAIDLGWINHFMRVLMGVFLGSGLVIYGEILSRKNEKYATWAKTLVGGGLAITYFVIYGAYYFDEYRVALGISQSLDVALLMLVTIISIGLSVKDNSKVIAAEAFFLGYATALLSNDFEMMTIIYTSLLTSGLVAVVAYKKWSVIGLGGIVASYLLYALWSNDNSGFLFPTIILLFYFLAFSIQSFFISKDKNLEVDNILMTIINSAFFFFLGFNILQKFYPDWSSSITLFLAIFYLIGFWFYKKAEVKSLSTGNLYLAIFFAILFVPIYFNEELITIIWALEVVLLAGLYLKTKNNVIKVWFNILGLGVAIKNIFFDSFLLNSFSGDNFFDSTRLISFLTTIICFYLIYGMINKFKESVPNFDFALLPAYAWVASILTVLIVFMEMIDEYPAWVSLILASLVFVYMLVGSNARYKEFFNQAIVVSIMLFLKLLFYDIFFLREFDAENVLGSTRLLTFAFVIWVFYLLYIYLKTLAPLNTTISYVARVYSWLAFVSLLLISFIEFSDDYPVALSIFLAFLSLIYVMISKISIRELFYQGLIVSIILGAKVLFYDLITLDSFEDSIDLSEARLLPLLAVMSVGYLLSYYLNKNVEKLKESDKPMLNIYSHLGTFFAFVLIVSEFREYGISIGWICLALALTILGFLFNKKHLRMQGIIILFISIFKVFIYDIRELEVIYRTISYIFLGIILLLISFLYTKYKDKIKEII